MYELKKMENYLQSKSVATGPSSYEKRIYRAAVSQSLRNTDVEARICPVTPLACRTLSAARAVSHLVLPAVSQNSAVFPPKPAKRDKEFNFPL
jgi:hypothetical protein